MIQCPKCNDQVINLSVEIGTMNLHILQCRNPKCNHREILNYRPTEDWDAPIEFWKEMSPEIERLYQEWKRLEPDLNNYKKDGFAHARESWTNKRNDAIKKMFKHFENLLFMKRALLDNKDDKE